MSPRRLRNRGQRAPQREAFQQKKRQLVACGVIDEEKEGWGTGSAAGSAASGRSAAMPSAGAVVRGEGGGGGQGRRTSFEDIVRDFEARFDVKLGEGKTEHQVVVRRLQQDCMSLMIKLPKTVKKMTVGEFNEIGSCDMIAYTKNTLQTPDRSTASLAASSSSVARIHMDTPAPFQQGGTNLSSFDQGGDNGGVCATIVKKTGGPTGTGKIPFDRVDVNWNLGAGVVVSTADSETKAKKEFEKLDPEAQEKTLHEMKELCEKLGSMIQGFRPNNEDSN